MSDSNFKENLTCGFKHDMMNFVSFYPITQKFENFPSMGLFCPKYMRFELRNTEELTFIKLSWDAKFE